jgi:hypothetical protein
VVDFDDYDDDNDNDEGSLRSYIHRTSKQNITRQKNIKYDKNRMILHT